MNDDVIGLRVAVLAGSIDANPPQDRPVDESVPIAIIIFFERETQTLKYYYYYHRHSIWLIWELLRTPQLPN